jgi:hypothetical protein
LRTIHSFAHLKPGLLQRFARKEPDQLIIVDDKDYRGSVLVFFSHVRIMISCFQKSSDVYRKS